MTAFAADCLLTRLAPPPDGAVFTLPTSTLVVDAVAALCRRGFLSAPIVKAAATQSTQYLGMFDMFTVIYVLLRSVAADKPADFNLATLTLADLCGTPQCGPFLPLTTAHSLLDAMLLLGKGGARRIPVLDAASGTLVNIITQSVVANLLAENSDTFAGKEGQPLAALGLASARTVLGVFVDESPLAAFALMQRSNVSALAILSRAGHLLGTVSSRDAQYLVLPEGDPSSLRHLMLYPLSVFLESVSRHHINTRFPAIRCGPEDLLGVTVARMCAARIHRIFVTLPGADHAIRVLSLRDIIAAVVREPTASYFSELLWNAQSHERQRLRDQALQPAANEQPAKSKWAHSDGACPVTTSPLLQRTAADC